MGPFKLLLMNKNPLNQSKLAKMEKPEKPKKPKKTKKKNRKNQSEICGSVWFFWVATPHIKTVLIP